MSLRTRTYALFIVKASLEDGRWANRILPLFRAKLPVKQRSLLTEIVYGTIKMKLALDFAISKFLKSYSLEDLTPWIRTILRMGTYQLLYLKKVPDYAVVKESVELAKRFGHVGVARLVNAILRRITEERPMSNEPWIRYSHPKWLFKRWLKRYGEEKTIEIMKHNNTPPPIYLRVNTLRTKIEDLCEILESSNVSFELISFPQETIKVSVPPQEIPIPEELYYAQDLSSQVVPYLLSPSINSLLYDAAVAPGGKSSHIYALTQGQITVFGVDKILSRLKVTKRVFRRLGVKDFFLVQGDSSVLTLRKKPEFALIDAPCSGLGTLRRKAELRWRMSEKRIRELSKLQKSLLEGVARNVPKGGVLVYSTCTTEPEENEENIENFLIEHRDFKLEDAREFVPPKFTGSDFLYIDGIKWDSDFSFGARLLKT